MDIQRFYFVFVSFLATNASFSLQEKKNGSIWKVLWHAIKGSVELYMAPITFVLVLLLWLQYIYKAKDFADCN